MMKKVRTRNLHVVLEVGPKKLFGPILYRTMRECYIGATEEEAFDDVRDILYAKYNAYQSWGVASSSTKIGGREEFDDFMRAKFLVGDARSVAERMRWLRDELNIDHVIARVRWPGLPEAKALETMQRLMEVAAAL